MEDLQTILCPRCELRRYTPYGFGLRATDEAPYPALSRMDNETYICSPCGNEEGMRDYTGEPPIPPSEWPIRRGRYGLGS